MPVLKAIGTLGELFPDQQIRCRVKGCGNSWTCAGDYAVQQRAGGGRPLERMCDRCHELFTALQDKEMACSSQGCEGKWLWTRFQQLEAQVQGRPHVPRGFCAACRDKKQTLQDRQMPCRMKGCKNTWIWTVSKQMMAGGKEPPAQLCDPCFKAVNTFQDRQIPCRMKGCKSTWTWNRYQQLEHQVAGKAADHPPKRMCPECLKRFNAAEDRQMPCRAPGCTGTWPWLRYDQLEHQLAADAAGKPAEEPHRLCAACNEQWQQLHDRRLHCTIAGCRGHVVYGRREQFDDLKNGRPERTEAMCEECVKALSGMATLPKSCSVTGCPGTWDYAATEQLADRYRNRPLPSDRRCPACEEFLKTHAAVDQACRDCGASFTLGSYEQLLIHTGAAKQPERCSDCARTLANRIHEAPPPVTHHFAVKMPVSGPWGSDPLVANLPRHVNHQVIAQAEAADCRIVVLGDEFAGGEEAPAWPEQVQVRLAERMAGRKICVINAAIPGGTSIQARLRLERDVIPFKPHLVLISLVYADAARSVPQELMSALCRELKQSGIRTIVVLPLAPQPELDKEAARDWKETIDRHYHAARSQWLLTVQETGVESIDLQTSLAPLAAKLMASWNRLNEAGQASVANLIANDIAGKNFL